MGLTTVGPGDFSRWRQAQMVARTMSPERAARVTPPPSARAAAPLRPPTHPGVAPAQRVASAPMSDNRVVAPAPSRTSVIVASEPFTSTVLSSEQKRAALEAMDRDEVSACHRCGLSRTRTHTVFGEGNCDAELMFIGEGPGAKEDQTGRPFVGPAGELLSRMIGAMGLSREKVYIANIVKCRAFHPGPPAKDRAPAPDETQACSPYLTRQAEIIRPRVIVTLGLPATQHVLGAATSMSRLRGAWSSWHGIRVMPTWHPSYLLRRERDGDVEPKRQAWSDLQQVMRELGLEATKKS